MAKVITFVLVVRHSIETRSNMFLISNLCLRHRVKTSRLVVELAVVNYFLEIKESVCTTDDVVSIVTFEQNLNCRTQDTFVSVTDQN